MRCWCVALGALLACQVAGAGGWPEHGADKAGTRYSPLAQINRSNVKLLQRAWTYRSGEMARRGGQFAHSKEQNIPIIAAGNLIYCSPFNRIVALDPATGSVRWVFDPEVSMDLVPPSSYGCRGVAAWTDPDQRDGHPCKVRILFGTNDLRVIALDASNGHPCAGFGDEGQVVTDAGAGQAFPGEIQYLMPPAIVNGVAVFGSAIADYGRIDGPRGTVRAFDVRTGQLRWTFDPVPRAPDNPAAATWGPGGPGAIGGGNVWANMAVDEALDLVYLPTASTTADSYGGSRPGNNDYTSSVVALRGASGEVAWHFQIVHHDLWGWDVAPQPLLVDLPVNGAVVPALVQNTKQGLIFVLNRATGETIYPVEERAVPAGSVPGEWYSPTQPFPTNMPVLNRHGITPDDAWGFTFWDRNACRRKIEALDYGSLYTPPSLKGALMSPWSGGGANWGGPAFDPARRLMVINTSRVLDTARLVPIAAARAAGSHKESELDGEASLMDGTPYAIQKGFVVSPFGAPCIAPPWGALSAIDLVTREVVWEVPLGSVEKLLPVPVPLTLGTPNIGGPIVTGGGLVFIAASFDDKLRAFDAESGEQLWVDKLPAGAQVAPMTYEADGRQFVVITAGGHSVIGNTRGDYVLAYALERADSSGARSFWDRLIDWFSALGRALFG